MGQIFTGQTKDLGDGFTVTRSIPQASLRAVGPFVFVDHFGPAQIIMGHELAVRPHPHIGLATVTYLYSGCIRHRDSIGNDCEIRPGDVNWMTAGRGIVHSEHSVKADPPAIMEGLQTWVALPVEDEQIEPSFRHYAASELPEQRQDGYTIRLIAGKYAGMQSPVATRSPLVYADIDVAKKVEFSLQKNSNQDLALYVVQGEFVVAGSSVSKGSIIVLEDNAECRLQTNGKGRAMLLGGEPLPEPRHVWWNFVSSSREKIEAAKEAWRANAMGTVAGQSDRIPLPE